MCVGGGHPNDDDDDDDVGCGSKERRCVIAVFLFLFSFPPLIGVVRNASTERGTLQYVPFLFERSSDRSYVRRKEDRRRSDDGRESERKLSESKKRQAPVLNVALVLKLDRPG